MKTVLALLFFSFSCFNVFAQTDYTGIYSFSFPVNREMSDLKPSKEDGGPSGQLIVAKMNGGNYSFWLSVNRGWPSYNNGFISGKIQVKNENAIFSQQDEYSNGTCVLKFTFKQGLIEIVSDGYEHCGFGHAVYADGNYKKSKKILSNAYFFSSLEGMGDVKTIKSEKAILYTDSNLQSPSKQYFIKNDKVYASQISKNAIFVEYMAKGQKYVYGWLKKEDL